MNMQNVGRATKRRNLCKVWLNQLRLQYLAPVQRLLATFWSWWIDELKPLLPAKLQTAFAQRNARDFIECEGDTFVVRRGTMTENVERARFSRSGTGWTDTERSVDVIESVVLLPAGSVLVKSIQLPLAAEENLREVLAFEMERQTPFTADQVYYDYIITSRSASRKMLSVDVVLSPRKTVDGLLENLASCDVRADVVSTRDIDLTAILPVNLLPPRQRSNGDNVQHRLNMALAGFLFVLLATAIAFPLLQKRQTLHELEPNLVEAIAQAKRADELHQQVERLVAGSSYLVEKKQREPSVLETLNELTLALPDHTWINRLDINGATVQVQGQSSSAALLISLLESSPRFENVSFRSPVTQVPSTGEERFHLSAEIEPEQSQ